jgi:hypothetical protein
LGSPTLVVESSVEHCAPVILKCQYLLGLDLETTATIAGLPPLHNTLVEVDLLMPEGQHLQIFSTDSIKRSVRLFQILYDKYLNSNSGSTTS